MFVWKLKPIKTKAAAIRTEKQNNCVANYVYSSG